jgi:hypothetical protein
MHNRWKIAVPAVAVGLTVGISLAARAGATSAPSPVDRNHPPALPALVNPDGSLNLQVAENIPVLQPDGSLRKPTLAELQGPQYTPQQVLAMTPAQRAAAHVQVTP